MINTLIYARPNTSSNTRGSTELIVVSTFGSTATPLYFSVLLWSATKQFGIWVHFEMLHPVTTNSPYTYTPRQVPSFQDEIVAQETSMVLAPRQVQSIAHRVRYRRILCLQQYVGGKFDNGSKRNETTREALLCFQSNPLPSNDPRVDAYPSPSSDNCNDRL